MENGEKRKNTLLLIEVAGLKNGLNYTAHSVAYVRARSLASVMSETPEESQKNYNIVYDSTLEKVQLIVCEKLEEIFSEEEIKELASWHQRPLFQKFLKSVDEESELYKSLSGLVAQLQKEVLKEMEIKMQMLRCDSSTALKN